MNHMQFLELTNVSSQKKDTLNQYNDKLKCYNPKLSIQINAIKTAKLNNVQKSDIGNFITFQLKSTAHLIIKELPKNVEFVYIKIPDHISLTLTKKGQN